MAHEWWHALDAYLVQWVNPSHFRLADGYLSLHDWAFPAATHPSAPKLLAALREILGLTGRTGQTSEFLRDAWKIAGMPRQGEYWYQRHEMIARAFEAYVQDGLAAQGQIKSATPAQKKRSKWKKAECGPISPCYLTSMQGR